LKAKIQEKEEAEEEEEVEDKKVVKKVKEEATDSDDEEITKKEEDSDMWSDKEKPVKPQKEEKEDEDDSDDKKVPEKIDPSKAAADLKKLRLDFLGKLSTKVLTATDKPFLNPTEVFNVLVWYKQD